jgi:excisionase family DNA binding protein
METGMLVKARVVSEALGIALSTVFRLAAAGRIPSYSVGRRGIRFDLEEVKAALRRSVSSSPAEKAEPSLSGASADMNGNNSSRNKR